MDGSSGTSPTQSITVGVDATNTNPGFPAPDSTDGDTLHGVSDTDSIDTYSVD